MMLRRRKSRNEGSVRGPRRVGRASIRSADVTGQWCEKQNRGPARLTGLLRRYRDRQPSASLGPPPPEDIASARGRHPCAEAVRANAPSIVGLIGPFHLSRPTSTSLKLVQFSILYPVVPGQRSRPEIRLTERTMESYRHIGGKVPPRRPAGMVAAGVLVPAVSSRNGNLDFQCG